MLSAGYVIKNTHYRLTEPLDDIKATVGELTASPTLAADMPNTSWGRGFVCL